MKHTRPHARNKHFRNILARMLALTTVLMLTIPAMPVGALDSGDTMYVTAGEYTIEKVIASFSNTNGILTEGEGYSVEDAGFVLSDEDQDGVFSIIIPEGAEKVNFIVSFVDSSFQSEHVAKNFRLSECTGNTLDLVTGEWYTLGSQPSTPLPDDSTTDSTPETGGFGYTNEQGKNTQTITPSGKVASTTPTTDVVSVDLTWQAMEFTFTPASQGTWDAETHAYVGGNEASWSSTTNQITVTNHSNVGITSSFEFQSKEGLSLEGEFHDSDDQTITSVDLDSAESISGEAGTPTSQAVTFHITGGSISEDTNALGTITITIAKQD